MVTMDELLKLSVEKHASDMHISANMPPMAQIDGQLVNLGDYPVLNGEEAWALLQTCMPEETKKLFAQNLEADFAIEIPNVARFRVNIFKHTRGHAGVFRIIPVKVPKLGDLGLPPLFKELTRLPRGLVLVTGPTGSGKSTTVAAMVNEINQEDRGHIITIEDPVEFCHSSAKSLIEQREVGRDTHSFSNALRAALREAPDVIFVGEMRDLETIRLALTAAETGHLVFGTLHTSSAPKTINRIIDVFPGDERPLVRSMLSESLQAVICQTLLRKKTGGRAIAMEIMVCNPAIRNLIREDKIAQMYSVIQTGSSLGMHTLDQHLKELVDTGVVEMSEAREKAANKADFQ
jgi:twitching motility protein PilT